jgi:hypothetical protein
MNRVKILCALAVILVIAGPRTVVRAQQPPSPSIDTAKKQAIVDEISALLNKNYIFPETARKVEEALRAKLKSGELNQLNDARAFANALSQTILAVGRDRHMGFSYNPAVAEDMRKMMGQSAEERRKVEERRLAESRRDNFGFRKVEQLPGNVGYLDFRQFVSPDLAGPTAIAALNFLAYCDAIIIDLRQNGGGEPALIQLMCTYFFPEMSHLNDIYYRESDSWENYWTLPYVPGARPVNADLYILTSSRTFSGAEEFTYNMKNLKRGTVIGETTGGGAHPTQTMIVQKDYILRVPFARSVNPFSKTNWEGTGVTPDIACPASEALDKAYVMALEKLSAKAANPDLKSRYEWILAGVKTKAGSAVLADEKALQSYAGEYEERKITFENGALFYQRTGPKFRMFPLTGTLFAVEGLDNFRIEFTVKDGRTVEMIGLYDDGRKEPSKRTK